LLSCATNQQLFLFQTSLFCSGFAAFLAERLCLSVRVLRLCRCAAKAEPQTIKSSTESQRLSARRAAKPQKTPSSSTTLKLWRTLFEKRSCAFPLVFGSGAESKKRRLES